MTVRPTTVRPTTVRPTPVRPRVRVAALGLAALAVLGTAACGGDSDGGGSNASQAEASGGTSMDQRLKLARCMREHGVDMADPKPGGDEMIRIDGNGANPQQVEEAMKACRSEAGIPAPKPLSQAEKDKQLQYARCMREHGVDMPDPTFDGRAAARPIPTSGPEKETFDKAQKACSSQAG